MMNRLLLTFLITIVIIEMLCFVHESFDSENASTELPQMTMK